MNPLDPETRRLIDAGKSFDDPSPADRARMRARLDASWARAELGAAKPTVKSALPHHLFSAKIVAGGFSALALLAVGVYPRHSTRQPVAAVATQSVPARARNHEVVEPAAALMVSATPEPVSVKVAAPAPEALARARAHAPRARRSDDKPVAAPALPPSAASAIEPSRPVPAPDAASPAAPSTRSDAPVHKAPEPAVQSLDDELALLGVAQDALRSGRPSQALQFVQQHAFRFPRGGLTPERLTVQTLALCALQRKAAAHQVFAELEQRTPESPVLARIRSDCAF